MQILSAAPKKGAKEEHILRRQKSGTPPNLIISRSKGLTESGNNKASDTSRSPTMLGDTCQLFQALGTINDCLGGNFLFVTLTLFRRIQIKKARSSVHGNFYSVSCFAFLGSLGRCAFEFLMGNDRLPGSFWGSFR
ncbi:hypothetical protein CEXT_78071 [Caerostris extrusa]|uniref:Uncharacterized protein n=1 Tax=Caerostris extrusa TaxID=172846 RepID=A0AAV4N0U0_CAEEX|nr:hypothetical protein CEXT_78071 [Caerostris extrusa]